MHIAQSDSCVGPRRRVHAICLVIRLLILHTSTTFLCALYSFRLTSEYCFSATLIEEALDARMHKRLMCIVVKAPASAQLPALEANGHCGSLAYCKVAFTRS